MANWEEIRSRMRAEEQAKARKGRDIVAVWIAKEDTDKDMQAVAELFDEVLDCMAAMLDQPAQYNFHIRVKNARDRLMKFLGRKSDGYTTTEPAADA